MDTSTASLVVVAILALVVVVLALPFRGRIQAILKGPFGTGLNVDASNPTSPATPGVKVEDARSQAGGLEARDGTGRGAEVSRIDVHGDIQVTSEPHPKVEPPT